MKIDRDMALKIGLGVVAVIVGLAALQFVIGLAAQLLPLAVLAVLGFVGYRVLSSRAGRGQAATKKAAPVQQAAAADDKPQEYKAVTRPEPTEQAAAADDSEGPLDYDELKEAETRIARLEEKEKQQPQVTDAVRAQIEERRRRLSGSGE